MKHQIQTIKLEKKKFPYFSEEYKLAHKDHKKVFVEWRKAGRPSDPNHPAKAAVLTSRRNLQYIARNETTNKSLDLHNFFSRRREPLSTGYCFRWGKKERNNVENQEGLAFRIFCRLLA